MDICPVSSDAEQSCSCGLGREVPAEIKRSGDMEPTAHRCHVSLRSRALTGIMIKRPPAKTATAAGEHVTVAGS